MRKKTLFITIIFIICSLALFSACAKDEPGEIKKYKKGGQVQYKIQYLKDDLTITAESDMYNLHINGDAGTLYTNVNIVINEHLDKKITLYLSNVRIKSATAAISFRGQTDQIEIVCEGKNYLEAGEGSSAIDGCDDVVISGQGELSVIGGATDGKGITGYAVLGNTLSVDIDGKLLIQGGSGRNGINGATGANGTTATLFAPSTPGGRGGDGTSGSKGGVAMPSSMTVNVVSGDVTIKGGTGGNGGNGGAGGTGGETSLVAQGQQPGGNGGNGGNAGRGGDEFGGEILGVNVKNLVGDNGIPGKGGAGGWSGGRRGYADATYQSYSGADGSISTN